MGRILLSILAVLVPVSLLAGETGAPEGYQARGMIIARHQPVISSEITARIESLPLGEGESFKKGDLLVSFNRDLLTAQHEKTSAELEAARLKLKNRQTLHQLKSIGALDVALAETEVKRWTAEMAITEIALDRCRIRAPFNGRVVTAYVGEHESVGTQQKLLKILGTDQLEIEVMAPSEWLTWLKPGRKFSVRLDAVSVETTARVFVVGAMVDPVSKMVKIRGRMDHTPGNLLPGMTATVVFRHE